MSNEITEKAFEIIDKIAEQLGVASEAVWETLCVQSVVEGASNLALTAILTLFFGLASVWILFKKKLSQRVADESKTSGYYTAPSIPAYILMVTGPTAIISFFVLVAHVTDWVSQVYNPQYWALEYITEMVK